MKYLKILAISAVLLSCGEMNKNTFDRSKFDLQGHRGARGLMPENTIPAFMVALKYGVNTLELDLAVTKDKQLLVSHEPWMNPVICTDSSGNRIEEERQFNIYTLTYDQIKQFDCGSNGNPRFPEQQLMKVHKPLLKEVIDTVNAFIAEEKLSDIRYNIEIKSLPEGDSIFHPVPAEYSDLVFQFISENLDLSKVTIQSFDFRILEYFNEKYPQVTLAALVENDKGVAANLDDLGFAPAIYSSYYKLLTESDIQLLHTKDIKVIPWTVNEKPDMQQLIDWKVDGLITDYPNRAQEVLNKL